MAISTGTIIDSGNGKGTLVISLGSLTTDKDNGGYLPIYDGTAYHFYKAAVSSKEAVADANSNNKVKFKFKLLIDEDSAYSYFGSDKTNGVEMYVRLRWTGLPENQYWYIPMDGNVLDALAGNGSKVTMFAYLSGIEILGNTTIYGMPVLKTDAGFESVGTELSYEQTIS